MVGEPIPTREIIDPLGIRRLAGNVTRTTLNRWRDRDDFPDPIPTSARSTELFDRRAVRAWLRTNVGERAGDGTLTRGN